MSFFDDEVRAGAATYTPMMLTVYDLIVLRLTAPLIWRCPARAIHQLYDRHLSATHIDVGVGTGYFLDKATFPTSRPHVALVDLNPHALAHAAKRIGRYRPGRYQRNALVPFELDGRRYHSASVNFVLHCLPGSITQKSVVFDHLLSHLEPGASVFGSTILGSDTAHTWPSSRLMRLYNRRGIFHNLDDRLADLDAVLASRFTEHRVTVEGVTAIFDARV